MIKNKLFISILLLFQLLSLCTWAVDVPIFTASTAKIVGVGDQFRLTFTITFHDTTSETDVKGFAFPKLQRFEILMGPLRATTKTMQCINGKNTVNKQISYTYILSALQEGVFAIPEATITVKGYQLRSQPLSVKVLPAGITFPTETKKPEEPEVFVSMNVSELSPRVNIPIVLECKLYTTALTIDSIANLEQIISPEDFKVESIDLRGNQWQLENHEGKNYHTAIFRKLLLYPRHIGKLHIGDLYMNTYYKYKITDEGPFEAFFSGIGKYEVTKKGVSCPGFTVYAH